MDVEIPLVEDVADSGDFVTTAREIGVRPDADAEEAEIDGLSPEEIAVKDPLLASLL